MITKVSPLAPKLYPELPEISGVKLSAIEAGIKYYGRKDLCLITFDKPAEIAGVFTKSKCSSAPVDWCRKHLSRGKANAIVINSGNANAFTGKKGYEAAAMTARSAANALDCNEKTVFLASTGVIGEPLDASDFDDKLQMAKAVLKSDNWHEAAQAIMTTDTYPKLSTRQFEVDDKTYSLNGIAKGSGMIAPDMATMLSFLFTDLPVDHKILQKLLSRLTKTTFNAVTVDSDTSPISLIFFPDPHDVSSTVSLVDVSLST
ncbi:MAG: bifunctional ornithine acetyltransferase/N-acetylglutamate synthase, partial [Pseudomonadota bacterium]